MICYKLKSLLCKISNFIKISPVLKKVNFLMGEVDKNDQGKNVWPWLTYPAISWLNKYINKEMKVFEFGSGNSTLFFSNRAASVISVEHDEKWYGKVAAQLKNNNIQNCRYSLFEPESAPYSTGKKKAIPGNYEAAGEKYRNNNFRNYCQSIAEYPDGYFDIILVDGRARASCLFHAKDKLIKGGIIILDNSERSRYAGAVKWLRKNGFKQSDFPGFGPLNSFIWITSVFKK